ncbi:hypothetical protein D3C76_1604050 [compost metagenome]
MAGGFFIGFHDLAQIHFDVGLYVSVSNDINAGERHQHHDGDGQQVDDQKPVPKLREH